MAWTKQQKAAHSKRMKEMWAKKQPNQLHSGDVHSSGANLDMVNSPAHYTFSKYEVADVSDAWYPNEPLLWNANKYMARWDKKGDPIENLEKLMWYVQRKINQLKEKRDAKVE